jgi:competence protein ComEA
MRTELPADRVQRRLTGSHADSDDPDAEDTEEPDTSLSRWLPDDTTPSPSRWITAIRADPGRAGVIGLGVVGAVAVLVTVFTLLNDEPPPVASAKLPPVQMVSSASPTTGAPAPTPDADVVVSVVGLVKQPGLVTLAPGKRISDALDAAGGPLGGADLVGLNMARKVADGEQIVVGIASPPGTAPVMASSISTSPGGEGKIPPVSENETAPRELVDLNTATLEQIETLPGVGPVTAAAIVAWRDANGGFANVEQLGEVDGIGPARLAKLHDLVHV